MDFIIRDNAVESLCRESPEYFSVPSFTVFSTVFYSAQEGPSSVHLVLSWPRHINSWESLNSWEHDMSWPRDHFVEVTTSLCSWPRDAMLRNDIHFSWPRLLMLREQHIFLVARVILTKSYVDHSTRDYQGFINILF